MSSVGANSKTAAPPNRRPALRRGVAGDETPTHAKREPVSRAAAVTRKANQPHSMISPQESAS